MKRAFKAILIAALGGCALYLGVKYHKHALTVVGLLLFFAAVIVLCATLADAIAPLRQGFKDAQLADVDGMEGHVFEQYLCYLFRQLGYTARQTPRSRDFGADLMLTKDGKKIAVQAKRYDGKVAVAAVQQAAASKAHYRADEAWLITNSYFTQSSYELALSNNVRLFSRNELSYLMEEARKIR